MWTFPIEVFATFDEIFILTYMFDGQLQKYYLDVFNTEYCYKSVGRINDRYKLTAYKQELDMTVIASLLHIYEGNLNNVGAVDYSLSKTHLTKLKRGKSPIMKLLQNNVYNFFKNVTKSKAKDNMWTSFKDVQASLKGDGYSKGFVACTCRATNDYREKTALAYICNRFTNPCIEQFFTANGVQINDDAVALSELVQWIFRSAIREGNDVDLYIPSERMRTLLLNL